MRAGWRIRSALIAVIVVAVGAFGWWKRDDARRPKPQHAAEAGDRARDPVAEERDLLRREVHRLSMEVAMLRAQNEAAARGNGEPAKAPRGPEVPPPTPELEARWLMARATLLDDVLAKQPRDDAWATAQEARARAVAAEKKGAGADLVSVACRSTACRMEWTYRDAEARLRHIEGLGRDFEELPSVSYAYPGEPAVHDRAIMFMAKRDHELPGLDYEKFLAGN